MQTIRNNIVRYAETNSTYFNSFITLTYAENVSDEDNAKYIKNFFDKLRKKHKDLRYIWVIERQKNGRIHIHFLSSLEFLMCNSKGRKSDKHKEIEKEFSKFWAYKGQILGFVDIRSIKTSDDKRRVIKYLAKYVSKDLDGTKIDADLHLWGYSRKTLDKPIIEKYEACISLEQLLKDFGKEYEITYISTYKNFIDGVEVGMTNYFDMYKKNINDKKEIIENGDIDN